MVKIDTNNLQFDFEKYKKKYTKFINKKKNEVNEIYSDKLVMNGWLNWPNDYFYKNDYLKIKSIYKSWQKMNISKYVVIGIGGSYIGIKACLKMCANDEIVSKFIFVSSVDQEYIIDTIKKLNNENWAIIVISKSGTTLETSLNFRIFREALVKKYKSKHNQRIVAITDLNDGKLIKIAKKNKYHTLKIESNIGGRYSTLTSVGLLVFKLANLDIDSMLKAWTSSINSYLKFKDETPIYYALIRYIMLKDFNKSVEVFATYNERLYFVSEHYKQIFAESEGKKKCLIPTIANYSVDLHSIGQLYQQGPKNFFETHLSYLYKSRVLKIPKSSFNNDDGLLYMEKFNLFDIEKIIKNGVIRAHSSDGDINCLEIIIDDMSESSFAQLLAFLDFSAFFSSLLIGVNPFDQPGVEYYKRAIKNNLSK